MAAVGLPAGIGSGLSSLLGRYAIEVTRYADVESFLAEETRVRARNHCLFLGADPTSAQGLRTLQALSSVAGAAAVFVVAETASSACRRAAIGAGATDVIEYPFMASYLANRLSECPQAASGELVYRAMLPEDAAMEQAFVRSLSQRSRYLRFFSALRELSPRTLYQFTHTHFPESHALVAAVSTPERQDIVAVARYAPGDGPDVADFAVVVADSWQGQGIATRLLRGLMAVAAVAGMRALKGMVLKENTRMLRLAEALGFERSRSAEDPTVWVVRRALSGLPRPPT